MLGCPPRTDCQEHLAVAAKGDILTVTTHDKQLLGPNPNRVRNSKKTAKERLRELLALFDKDDDVLVVINADPDALASAMAVKRLLRYRVKSVTIGYPNEIRRLSNMTMVEVLKIPAERLNTLKQKEYTKRVMLDSQPSHLPCFENLDFHAVIDHHPATKGWVASFVDIRKDYGATASMMVEYLRAAGLKPSVLLATALFYAIKVDTHNFEKRSHPADAIAFRYLFNIANQNLMRKIEFSEYRRSELNYFRIALTENEGEQPEALRPPGTGSDPGCSGDDRRFPESGTRGFLGSGFGAAQ